MLRKIYFWIITFFKFEIDVIKVAPKQRRQRKQKEKPDSYVDWNFKDLLDTLDSVFKNLKDPDMVVGDLSRHDTHALKTIGPHVLRTEFDPDDMRLLDDMPMIMYVHIKPDKYDDNKLPICSFYAIKIEKLPFFVQPINGVHYTCGLCLKLKEKKKKYNAWLQAYVTITPDKTIVNLILRNHQVGKVNYRTWDMPDMGGDTRKAREECILSTFRHTFVYWINRERFWHIKVTKGKRHCTFAIPMNDATRFFRDRDLSILKIDGTRKAIMHFVKSHYRTYKTGYIATVKTHIRGLRNFQWNNYNIEINHPGHKKRSISTLTIGADASGEPTNQKRVTLSQAAKRINEVVT